MAKKQPKVSIIIPFSKPDLIDGAIESIDAQDYPRRLIEVIVVGKSSRQVKKKWKIKAVDQGPILQPGKARNLGAQKATGEVFLFMDDDCRAQPGWIKENLKELKNKKVGAVGGRVLGVSEGYFAQCYDFTAFSQHQINKRRLIHVPTASLGVKREVFKELGGFDRELRFVEDNDFCCRLFQKGYQVIYQPKIKVFHDHQRKTISDFLTYTHAAGRLSGLIMARRYPQFNLRLKLFSLVDHPLIYAFLIIPMSLLVTLIMIMTNVFEYPKVLLLAPTMFLGQIGYHFGVWQWLLANKKK